MKHLALVLCCLIGTSSTQTENYPLYFCTAASPEYFNALLNLIGSIHKHHSDDLGEIAVFDLGLKKEQIQHLKQIDRLRICALELKHPDILKPIPRAGTYGEGKVGSYAFKPVVVKQGLDLYPYFLWLDAGTTVFGSLRILFDHIREKGYFLHNGRGTDWPLRKQLCSFPAKTFGLDKKEYAWILGPNVLGIEAGVMGFTPRVRDNLVMPIYEAAGDLRNFIDDGTSSEGRGTARPDQAVVAVQAYVAGLPIHHHVQKDLEALPFIIEVSGKKHWFRIGSCQNPFNENFQGILTLRRRLTWFNHFVSYIRKRTQA